MGIHLMHPFRRRERRYPIKRDQSGKSARRRAFDLFDRGLRPSAVAPQVGISPQTAYRYFQDWKKGPHHLEMKCRLLKAALRGKHITAAELADAFADVLGVPRQQVLEELEKPWSLRRLVSGKLQALQTRGAERRTLLRLEAAIRLVHLYEAMGVAPQRIVEELDRLAREEAKRPSSTPPRR